MFFELQSPTQTCSSHLTHYFIAFEKKTHIFSSLLKFEKDLDTEQKHIFPTPRHLPPMTSCQNKLVTQYVYFQNCTMYMSFVRKSLSRSKKKILEKSEIQWSAFSGLNFLLKESVSKEYVFPTFSFFTFCVTPIGPLYYWTSCTIYQNN